MQFVDIQKSGLAHIMALLSYSIVSGVPVTLTRVKCWNINHQNHKRTYSHEPHDENDKSTQYYTLCDFDDWYFSIWQSSMPLEIHWQLNNWVGLMRVIWVSNWVNSISHIFYLCLAVGWHLQSQLNCHYNHKVDGDANEFNLFKICNV